ncbi:MAG: hypothetical protein IPI67_17760 [Myxococcales bacterium]|nr:hypothetical protein [Myxococcales bacterium]
MTVERRKLTATLRSDGRVLLIGGASETVAALSSAEIFDPVAGSFTALPTGMATARAGHAAAKLNGGRVLVVGGEGSANAPTTAEMYLESSNSFTPVSNPPNSPAGGWSHHTATTTLDGRSVVVIGNDVLGDSNPNNWKRRAPAIFTLQGPGKSCSLAVECESGLCADGVCCNSACTGLCLACGSNGQCGNAPAGSADPGCVVDPTKPCGLTGKCGGGGSCAVAAKDTVCGAASCTSGSSSTPKCDGSGLCDPNPKPCLPYSCGPTACLLSCAGAQDCASGYYCDASDSQCKLQSGGGGACTSQAQCPRTPIAWMVAAATHLARERAWPARRR